MKVNIGKYKNWIGPYQIAEMLMFWVPKEKDELGFPHTAEKVHKFGKWLSDINWLCYICNWIERNKKLKIDIRIDPWDTWSMDSTLSMIILPMLKQLKATQHGSPQVDMEDIPEEFRKTTTYNYDSQLTLDFYDTDLNVEDEIIHTPWAWVMDEMIWTFERLNDDDDDAQFHSGNSEALFQALDKDNKPIGNPEPIESRINHEGVVTYEMVKGPNDTSVYDYEGHMKHTARIANGLRLFGKYYRGLWD